MRAARRCIRCRRPCVYQATELAAEDELGPNDVFASPPPNKGFERTRPSHTPGGGGGGGGGGEDDDEDEASSDGSGSGRQDDDDRGRVVAAVSQRRKTKRRTVPPASYKGPVTNNAVFDSSTPPPPKAAAIAVSIEEGEYLETAAGVHDGDGPDAPDVAEATDA